LRELPDGLSRKAEAILLVYGGPEGLIEQPNWLVSLVLKSFFSEKEGRIITDYLARLRTRKVIT
jgi:hypothetical protein